RKKRGRRNEHASEIVMPALVVGIHVFLFIPTSAPAAAPCRRSSGRGLPFFDACTPAPRRAEESGRSHAQCLRLQPVQPAPATGPRPPPAHPKGAHAAEACRRPADKVWIP